MSQLRKVAVLGCGKIGRLVTYLLADSGDYAVTAVDLTLENAKGALSLPGGMTLRNADAKGADFTDKKILAEVLKGKDFVVSCAPYHCNVGIAETARDLGVSYLDLTEDVQTTHAIKKLAQGSGRSFVPQCGLAPGFITIAASHLAQEFETLETVKMRVGALPMYPHNKLKYNLTWSTEGLINEYGNPCEAVIDGNVTLVPPLEGLETLCVDGIEYEAFNTSGGLGTLAESWAGRVRNLNYKSIRYPGHREIIALLMNDLKLNDDRDTLKKIFEKALPTTVQDVVLIFVTVSGWKSGRYLQKSYVKKIYSEVLGGERWGAIQITTASGVCAVLDLIAENKVKSTGFVRQEDVPFEAFIANRFGRYYS